jgi:hypothetical protein
MWKIAHEGDGCLDLEFPEYREINREFFEISHDVGLLGRFWEPVAKRIQ